jgi:hypothetical protein
MADEPKGPSLRRCLWWLVALAVAIILVDLFCFSYRLIGPTLFGILCFLGGVTLGRTPPYVAHLGSGAHKGWRLLLPLPFLAVGIIGLSCPLLIDLPDPVPFMWGVWTPDGQHLGRYRLTQIFVSPAFLWMGSVFLASIVRSIVARPRSQAKAEEKGGVSSPDAGGSITVGMHPWIYTLGLYMILMLVTLRGILSR